MIQTQQKTWRIGVVFILLFGLIWFLAAQIPSAWELSDFNVTFYPLARHLLSGENVYLSPYPHPFNGRDEPPLAPIWIFYTLIPFGTLPLPIAEGLRVALDSAAIPFLAYLCARWAQLRQIGQVVTLLLAPWLLLELHTGQLTPVAFLGVLLCYWGTRRASAPISAVGLFLASVKFNLVLLVLLATLYFAWRQKILMRTLIILGTLVAAGSVASPLWFADLLQMYLARMANPSPTDVVLLVPFFPWGQFLVLGLSLLVLIAYVYHNRPAQPTRGLWAGLTCVSLICAFHTFPYDWLVLMLPIAYLLRYRRSALVVGVLYAYSFLWAFLLVSGWFKLPSPAIIPSALLVAFLVYMIYIKPSVGPALVAIEPQHGASERKG